jgi:dTDP-4-amino-4,6-dideoxygalactose transaminase
MSTKKNIKVPVFDLKRQYREIKREIDAGVSNVLVGGFYILGENVAAFEREFAEYYGVKYAVGVASGTDALKIALQASGIKPGDEVITTPFTFVATAEAIHTIGAKVVFADINLDTYNIDPQEIEKKLTRKTKAILCVHLYGQPCNMQGIIKLIRRYRLKLIEDCAQATGTEYNGKKVGTFGDAGAFSFFPTKNLGAYGDGGIIITDNKLLFRRAKMLRVHGSLSKYEHIMHGFNSRLDELQAAILRTKLKYLHKWNQSRRRIATRYNKKLADLENNGFIVRPKEAKNSKHVYHLYTLRVKRRAALTEFLKTRGIGTAFHYPVPLHLQKAYKELRYRRGDFPNAELAAREIVTFPLYPELKKREVDYVAGSILEFFKRQR